MKRKMVKRSTDGGNRFWASKKDEKTLKGNEKFLKLNHRRKY